MKFTIRLRSAINELWVPAVALGLFFLLQARGHMSELGLTLLMIGVASLIFYWQDRVQERYLFAIGVLLGLVIEVGFRFLGYQQVWVEASLLGVPYWLPLAWGVGFVLITRFGVMVRGLRVSD